MEWSGGEVGGDGWLGSGEVGMSVLLDGSGAGV